MEVKRSKTMDKEELKETYERCVICGCLTDIPIERPIFLRQHYVEGAGQLCGICFREHYRIYGNMAGGGGWEY